MTLQVCVLGIDGSGKSTVTTALPHLLAAEFNVRAGSAGDVFRVVDADEDHLAPNFHPDGFPVTGHLSKWFKRWAKRTADSRRFYPLFKLSQMIFQDATAYRLGRRYGADVVVSDGNVILSSTGRAGNYTRPASEGANVGVQSPDASDLKAVFAYLLEGKPLTEESQAKLPPLGKAWMLQRVARRMRIHAGWLPDVVLFLDLSPEIAIERIASRGQKVDLHENADDLAQARRAYLRTLDAFGQYTSPDVAHRIAVDNLTPGETLQVAIDVLRPHITAIQRTAAAAKDPLGTSNEKLMTKAMWKRTLSFNYIFRNLIGNWFRGSWRELTFMSSSLGRLLLREGYSASVMRVIYDQDDKRYGLLNRVFMGHALHRAVYDRLHILTKYIEADLEERLRAGREVTIFTAPSGFAYDLFRPLASIAARHPEGLKHVRVVAADLDPHDYLAKELSERAESLGLRFDFLRGDITEDAMRARFEEAAPFDMVLFVGLSAWLPKPQMIHHIKWVYRNVQKDATFVTDSFTPDAYALSGRYTGWKAHYYTPDLYQALMDYCGFDSLNARVESGRNGINHVMLFSPRVSTDVRQATSEEGAEP